MDTTWDPGRADMVDVTGINPTTSREEGRNVITVIVGFTQNSTNYKCYDDFARVGVIYLNFGYHRGSDQAQEHRASWDPSDPRWRWLGVQPSLIEGGMSTTKSFRVLESAKMQHAMHDCACPPIPRYSLPA